MMVVMLNITVLSVNVRCLTVGKSLYFSFSIGKSVKLWKF